MLSTRTVSALKQDGMMSQGWTDRGDMVRILAGAQWKRQGHDKGVSIS